MDSPHSQHQPVSITPRSHLGTGADFGHPPRDSGRRHPVAARRRLTARDFAPGGCVQGAASPQRPASGAACRLCHQPPPGGRKNHAPLLICQLYNLARNRPAGYPPGLFGSSTPSGSSRRAAQRAATIPPSLAPIPCYTRGGGTGVGELRGEPHPALRDTPHPNLPPQGGKGNWPPTRPSRAMTRSIASSWKPPAEARPRGRKRSAQLQHLSPQAGATPPAPSPGRGERTPHLP